MSSAHAQSLAPVWGTSFLCGTDMSWRCLQHLLASLCDQDSVSTPFLCALPGANICACALQRCVSTRMQ